MNYSYGANNDSHAGSAGKGAGGVKGDNDKAIELIRDVKSQIEKQLAKEYVSEYRVEVGENVRWFTPGHKHPPETIMKCVYWVLEQIEHAANDSEQAP